MRPDADTEQVPVIPPPPRRALLWSTVRVCAAILAVAALICFLF